ncbi:hypothetical protein [Rudaea sp.]|uniref:hypothetical protein n=1 Tax=Rudaea sp. TaxID=2136325 RepID=UPI002ED26ACA
MLFERVRPVIPKILVWSGPVACAIGLLTHRMWEAFPAGRFVETLELALVSTVVATALGRLFRWRWANGYAVFWGAALVFFTGVAPVAASLLLAATAFAVGSLFVASRGLGATLIALPTGLALIGGCLGWFLPLGVHTRVVYLTTTIAVCVWRWRVLLVMATTLRRAWREAVDAAPLHSAVAVLVVGIALTGAWLPTMQSDDLAYHLGLPTQLQRNGFYAMDPTLQIWALAPWLGDVIQGIAQVLAGREARGAVDSLWLLAAAALLGRLTMALRADARLGWQVVAVFASMPLLAGLAAGMQTELPAIALMAAFVLLVLRDECNDDRSFYLGAILIGGLFGLKFGQAISALAMLIWAGARIHAGVGAKTALAGVGIFLLVAGSSYFHAWHVSGNPMLPLFNNVFQSAVMPAHQLHDARWHAGFSALLPWLITFDTPRYADGDPGGYGFVLVAYAGAWLWALYRRETRAYALTASAVMLLPLLPMQYARYAFPGLVLLLPVLTVAGSAAVGPSHFSILAYVLCVLNLAFQANGPWPLDTVARKRLLTNLGDTEVVLQRFAPERLLIAELRKRDPSDSIILSLDRQAPFVAELAGCGRTVSWYAPSLDAAASAADADPGGAAWRRLIDDSGARWLLLHANRLSPAQRAALAAPDAERVRAIDNAELWAWKIPAQRHPSP